MKDPAMLFYTSDFLTGVMLLSMKERGQYITLLCLQQQMGHMSLKQMKTAVGALSPAVMEKFTEDENGLFYNRRAEIEIRKRADHCKKQKENVSKRYSPDRENNNKELSTKEPVLPLHGSTTVATVVLPLENENENRNINNLDISKENVESNDLVRGECEGGDAELGQVMDAYTNKIGFLSSAGVAELKAFYESFGAFVVLHALEVAINNGKMNWAYIRGVLRGYQRDGLNNIHDVIEAEVEFEKRKQGAPRGGGKFIFAKKNQPILPDMSVEELERMAERI